MLFIMGIKSFIMFIIIHVVFYYYLAKVSLW